MLSLNGVNDILLTNFTGTKYVTVKFHQDNSSEKFYRLRCEPYSSTGGFPTIYLYLGSYNTSPEWRYTHAFPIQYASTSFQDLFTAHPTLTEIRYIVYLQSSTNDGFAGRTESQQSTFYIKLDTSVNSAFAPIWNVPTWEDARYSSTIGKITRNNKNGLQSISNMRINYQAATAQYGTSISKYYITIPGAFSRSYTSAQIIDFDLATYKTVASSVKVEFKVEDTRGMLRSYTRTISIYPYQPPLITVNNTHRQNGTGSTLILDFRGDWYGDPPLNDGTNPLLLCNSITAFEEGSSAALATLVPAITVSNKKFSYINQLWTGISFDSSKAYRLDFELTDGIKTVTTSLAIPVGTPTVSIRNQKVGINYATPSYALDVIGIIAQNGYPIIGCVGEIGNDYTANLNDYTDAGYYFYSGLSAAILNFPNTTSPNRTFLMEVIGGGDYLIQKIFYTYDCETHVRVYNAQGWTSWKKVAMT